MLIELTTKWEKWLRSKPESGMGYQLVDVRLKTGEKLVRVPVYNASDLDAPPGISFTPQDIASLTLHNPG